MFGTSSLLFYQAVAAAVLFLLIVVMTVKAVRLVLNWNKLRDREIGVTPNFPVKTLAICVIAVFAMTWGLVNVTLWSPKANLSTTSVAERIDREEVREEAEPRPEFVHTEPRYESRAQDTEALRKNTVDEFDSLPVVED